MNKQTNILNGFTILCVEDEIGVRNELAKFLNRRVKTLHLACNGAEGLAMFKEHSPDIVITDILMPVIASILFLPNSKKIINLQKIITK